MPDWQKSAEDLLLQRAQDGDAEAYGQLYEHYAPAVFRFLHAHLSERPEVEDLTAEVFLRVWRTLPRYQDRGLPFAAYLFRVAHNALIDFYRQTRRKNESSLDPDDPIRDHQPGPAEQTASNLEGQQLRQTLERLSPDYREVLTLRFLSELTPEETAGVMGRSVGAVRVLQHRALAALRSIMET
jgi:RNA polymerase sigma-70 factor (ECF subfamily)